MASYLERVAEDFEGKYPEIASLLRADAQVARKLGVPEELANHRVNTSEATPLQLNLNREWERQASRLADLFASELGQSRDEYVEGLPRFSPQPEGYKGRFDTPVIVQTSTSKLTLARMLEIAGIVNYLKLENVQDWREDKFRTPNAPYITWLHDGSRNLNRSVKGVRAKLADDERGGTVFDGIALLQQDPQILKRRYLDLPGSQYGFDCAPRLGLWDGRPGLRCRFVDRAGDGWGSVVAGRNIVTR